jgi:hypothetical protein
MSLVAMKVLSRLTLFWFIIAIYSIFKASLEMSYNLMRGEIVDLTHGHVTLDQSLLADCGLFDIEVHACAARYNLQLGVVCHGITRSLDCVKISASRCRYMLLFMQYQRLRQTCMAQTRDP